MSNKTNNPHAVGNRWCGLRQGLYVRTAEIQSIQELQASIIDPIPLWPQTLLNELGVTPQGQSFTSLPGLGNVIIDYLSKECPPAAFVYEAARKGCSNKIRTDVLGMDKNELRGLLKQYEEGMPILYISPLAYIYPQYWSLYYDDRKHKQIPFVDHKFCIRDLPIHSKTEWEKTMKSAPQDQYPDMCASLLFEDLPIQYRNGKERVIDYPVGDMILHAAVAPSFGIDHGTAPFFMSRITELDICYPDDQERAEAVADLLGNIGLNISYKISEF